jgi:hypothetical protein
MLATPSSRILSPTCVSDLFFSDLNRDALQQGIRYGVYRQSPQKSVIGRQDDRQLELVMRSIYLQYGENRPDRIVEQVQSLNARVLEYCVPQIVREIEMYRHYVQDIHNMPMPLERSVNTSSAGTGHRELSRAAL